MSKNILYRIIVKVDKTGFNSEVCEVDYYIDDDGYICYRNRKHESKIYPYRLDKLVNSHVIPEKPEVELFTFSRDRIEGYISYMEMFLKSELISQVNYIDGLLNTLD